MRNRFRRAVMAGLTLMGVGLAVMTAHAQTTTLTHDDIVAQFQTAFDYTLTPDTLCPPLRFPPLTWDEVQAAGSPLARGIGHFIGTNDISDAVMLGEDTYQVPANQALTVTLHGMYADTSPGAEAASMRYVTLLNQQQINAFPDEAAILDVTVSPNSSEDIVLTLPPLEPGLHDLIIIGRLQESLSNYGDVNTFPHYLTLIAGDTVTLPRQTYTQLTADQEENRRESFFALSLHTERSNFIWVWPDVYRSVEPVFDLFVSAGNLDNLALLPERNPQLTGTFALVGFLNDEQVALSDEQAVLLFAAEPQNVLSYIPVTVDAGDIRGQAELQIIRINYPGIPRCWLRENTLIPALDSSVYVDRVGVDIDDDS